MNAAAVPIEARACSSLPQISKTLIRRESCKTSRAGVLGPNRTNRVARSRDAFNASTRERYTGTVDVSYRAEIYHDVGRLVLVYFPQNGLAKLSRVCKIDIS